MEGMDTEIILGMLFTNYLKNDVKYIWSFVGYIQPMTRQAQQYATEMI